MNTRLARLAAVSVAVLLAACSKPADPPAAKAPLPAAQPKTAPPTPAVPATQPKAGWAPVRVKIVDLQGNPLPYAVPIATAQPNAFEKPDIIGEPANEKGEATFSVPPDKRLYVRAWDFSMQMFANNYYDVYPGPVMEAGVMKLVMVPGATLCMELVAPDGTHPPAGTQVGLMMVHPSQGPWWPSEARCDDKGMVVFPKVPAGIFSLKLKLETGPTAEVPSVTLQPGGFQNAGKVTLN